MTSIENISKRNKLAAFMAVISAAMFVAVTPAEAEVLQGNITKSDTLMRLSRPSSGNLGNQLPPVAPPIRLSRAPSMNAGQGLVDTSSFNSPFNGRVREDQARQGLVRTADFSAPSKFDLGAEENSRELKLAWEKWHKQMSRVIYERWQRVADEPGKATLRVTVTKDRSIRITVIRSSGSHSFDRKLTTVIQGLEGDPGLTFPGQSQRTLVSFEADYVAASNVTPGYSWVRDDYETIRE